MQCPWPHCRGIVYSTPQWHEHVSNFIFGSDTHHYVGNHVQAFALQPLKPFVYNRNQSLFTEIIQLFLAPPIPSLLPSSFPSLPKEKQKRKEKRTRTSTKHSRSEDSYTAKNADLCKRVTVTRVFARSLNFCWKGTRVTEVCICFSSAVHLDKSKKEHEDRVITAMGYSIIMLLKFLIATGCVLEIEVKGNAVLKYQQAVKCSTIQWSILAHYE